MVKGHDMNLFTGLIRQQLPKKERVEECQHEKCGGIIQAYAPRQQDKETGKVYHFHCGTKLQDNLVEELRKNAAL